MRGAGRVAGALCAAVALTLAPVADSCARDGSCLRGSSSSGSEDLLLALSDARLEDCCAGAYTQRKFSESI